MRTARRGIVLMALCLTATAVPLSGVAGAGTSPSVDGWVISWADDGWYQVQTADGETVCEDGRSCDVKSKGAGDYKVINHSTNPKGIWIVPVNGSAGSSGSSNSSGSKSSAAGKPNPPTFESLSLKRPAGGKSYVSVIWQPVRSHEKVNVYREGSYIATVEAKDGNVFNDFSGKIGYSYSLIRVSNGDFSVHSPEKRVRDPRDDVPRQPAPEVVDNTIVSNSEGEIVVNRSIDNLLPPAFYCRIPHRGGSCEVPNGTYIVVNVETRQEFILKVYGKPSDIGTLVGTRENGKAIIMWMDDPDTVGAYTVTRDGKTVSTGTDLSFFYDAEAQPSRTYTYKVSLQVPGRARLHGSIELKPNASTEVVRGRSTSDSEINAFVNSRVENPGRSRAETLQDIDEGNYTPNPDSRLGAYDATAGYPEGTVGYAAHQAIGMIYTLLGNTGEEQIGTVFNSPEAVALYNQPVNGPASTRLAEMEYAYWTSRLPTLGGWMGSLFPPILRDHIQRYLGGDQQPSGGNSGGDEDGDDIPDYLDPDTMPANDQDGDGTPDLIDDFNDSDNDDDGIPDDFDLDDDNDGILDVDDPQPTVANTGGTTGGETTGGDSGDNPPTTTPKPEPKCGEGSLDAAESSSNC